jgi:hypothetical protein
MGIGCALRISGRSFDVDRFLEQTEVVPTAIWHKGAKRSRSRPPEQQDGCTITVSDADELRLQCLDAVRFLESNRKWLDSMCDTWNVVDPLLDFSSSMPEERIYAQSYRFPLELIRSAAKYGISIELSTYRVSPCDVPTKRIQGEECGGKV